MLYPIRFILTNLQESNKDLAIKTVMPESLKAGTGFECNIKRSLTSKKSCHHIWLLSENCIIPDTFMYYKLADEDCSGKTNKPQACQQEVVLQLCVQATSSALSQKESCTYQSIPEAA